MALAVPALFGTVALPAYASFAPADDASQSSALQVLKESGAQSLKVDADVAATAVSRDGYTATTEGELAAMRAATEAAQRAAQQRAEFATNVTSYTGPSAGDFLENPPYPSFSLDQVFQVALQYQGVPYVYGGATPAGFDCSGFVMYVFAQFGISLPHSSTAQGNMGTRISWEDAVPGDLVVRPGHIGFYAGNGMMLHASRPGVPLQVSPIYYPEQSWVVRIGI